MCHSACPPRRRLTCFPNSDEAVDCNERQKEKAGEREKDQEKDNPADFQAESEAKTRHNRNTRNEPLTHFLLLPPIPSHQESRVRIVSGAETQRQSM